MTEVIATLIGLAAIGLAIIAYRYPDEYQTLAVIVVLVGLSGFILCTAWNTASLRTETALIPFLDNPQPDASKQEALESVRFSPLVVWGFAALAFYGLLLSFMKFLRSQETEKPNDGASG